MPFLQRASPCLAALLACGCSLALDFDALVAGSGGGGSAGEGVAGATTTGTGGAGGGGGSTGCSELPCVPDRLLELGADGCHSVVVDEAAARAYFTVYSVEDAMGAVADGLYAYNFGTSGYVELEAARDASMISLTDTDAFFTSDDGISRVPKLSGAPAPVAGPMGPAFGLFVASGSVYWTRGSGTPALGATELPAGRGTVLVSAGDTVGTAEVSRPLNVVGRGALLYFTDFDAEASKGGLYRVGQDGTGLERIASANSAWGLHFESIGGVDHVFFTVAGGASVAIASGASWEIRQLVRGSPDQDLAGAFILADGDHAYWSLRATAGRPRGRVLRCPLDRLEAGAVEVVAEFDGEHPIGLWRAALEGQEALFVCTAGGPSSGLQKLPVAP